MKIHTPLLFLTLPVVATLLGGLLAIRFRRLRPLLVAVGAGLLLGAAFLDLLPEALTLVSAIQGRPTDVLGTTLLSFLVFFAIQTAMDGISARWQGSNRALGKVGGLLLIFHSLRDGMAIGLSYAASHPAGYAVAAGIAAHDLGDGMNTVILTTGGRRPRLVDSLFLAADALAPLAGGLLTIWWSFSARASAILLAVAAGFFLQMATSDFLPQVRRKSPAPPLVLPAVLCGAGAIYLANMIAGYWL